MQSLDHVEVKIFLCEDFIPVLTVPLQRGTSKLSTRRKVDQMFTSAHIYYSR